MHSHFLLPNVFLQKTAEEYLDTKRILVLVCDYTTAHKKRLYHFLRDKAYDTKNFEIKVLSDLLNMASDDAELYAEFTSLLPKPVVLPKVNSQATEVNEPHTPIEIECQVSEKDDFTTLIKEVESWQVCDENGKNRHREYEKLCVRVLKTLFHDELSLWNEQSTTLDGLNRFDIVCKIKAKGNDFWDTLEHHFHSKYIIFECKNYQDRITQREVYTTEKYLYTTALRRVAILVSVNGTGDSAEKAIRGVLRETGKLIVSVTNKDLVEMLKQKRAGQNPALEVLDKLLDELLVKLEK
ncbi:MAG: hypothetical protein J6I89_07260 [Oscillospiraceae bacterium]|nr:hypothetical protein [Oscillospiraceae bacterium]